jgi:peroxiredoxin
LRVAKEIKMSFDRRRTFYALALVLTLTLSCVALPQPRTSAASAPLEFKLKTTDGGEISSEMLRGDVVVLAFGSSFLGTLSKTQVQGVQELADHYANRQVRVYWVSTDSASPKSKTYATDEQLNAFARKNGLKLGVLRDPDGALFKQTGADQLPAVVILDPAGNVSGTPIGGLDPKRTLVEVLSGRLDKLVAEK